MMPIIKRYKIFVSNQKKKNMNQKFEKIEKILSIRIKQLENLNQSLISNNKLILPN
jgi:hypothetical protein